MILDDRSALVYGDEVRGLTLDVGLAPRAFLVGVTVNTDPDVGGVELMVWLGPLWLSLWRSSELRSWARIVRAHDPRRSL